MSNLVLIGTKALYYVDYNNCRGKNMACRFGFARRSRCILFSSVITLTLAALEPVLAADSPPWREMPKVQERSFSPAGKRLIVPQRYRTVVLDWAVLDATLLSAPLAQFQAGSTAGPELSLPLADGSFGRFRIQESPIMDDSLAARLPDVKTYRAVGIDDPSAIGHLDTTPAGFHALIRSNAGTVYIDPYARGETDVYLVYNKRDFDLPVSERPMCRVGDPGPAFSTPGLPALDLGSLQAAVTTIATNGGTFKQIRLAVAATAEYTTFHGGTVAAAQAAIVTTINRVNVVYEHDLAIRMNLVDNTGIVFTNAGTDPYSNTCNGAELAANQTTIDNVIGAGNYDLGHVVGGPGGGGGFAGPGPCLIFPGNNSHAQGCTGSNNPSGDPFDIDFVAHEIGHQWGAPHTFNGSVGSCAGNRSAGAAYEPGSGSTIMAYAGICGTDNLQNNSDDYFHGSSLETIAGYDPTVFGALQCIQMTPSGNTPPTAGAGADRNIPFGTPFTLCGTGTDPDGGDNPTFLWEEYDLGAAAGPPNNPNSAPFFRSFDPTASNCRTLPKLNDILTNTQTNGEILPGVAAAMTFRLTVFDNHPGAVGGGFDQDEVNVTVDGTAGPFQITSPNTAVNWTAGAMETVTWNVAGTNAAPINCANVDLLFSQDGGFTFPTVLANGTPNDGTQPITVPNVATTTARIKAECSDNVFFDINNTNFSIGGGGVCVDDAFEATGDPGSGGNTGTDDACYGNTLGAVPTAPQTHAHCNEDWVYFAATSGTTYRIETSNLTGGADTVISVHSNCGAVLATDDNGGAGLGSLLDFTPTVTGFLDVRVFRNAGYTGAQEGYDITVTVAPGCPANLALTNQAVVGVETFSAANQIDTGPGFIVNPGASATLTAGNSVVLGNGTSIFGDLTVNLAPCPL